MTPYTLPKTVHSAASSLVGGSNWLSYCRQGIIIRSAMQPRILVPKITLVRALHSFQTSIARTPVVSPDRTFLFCVFLTCRETCLETRYLPLPPFCHYYAAHALLPSLLRKYLSPITKIFRHSPTARTSHSRLLTRACLRAPSVKSGWMNFNTILVHKVPRTLPVPEVPPSRRPR